ncbi:MAG TPA: hypothetical protein VFX16_29150 [Pseudonocardiaceae bacterium]|nr:hypothetical protein [Pseudonocardiaceae bacterium]
MSWQDDLRQLDQELAEGRISADGYRQRRDQVLASYSSGGSEAPRPDQSGPLPQMPPDPNPHPGTPPRGEQQPPQQPQQQPQQGASPFAPPFRWTSVNPDTTQVVGSSDATQVVRGDSLSGSDATQVVGQGSQDATQSFRPVTGPPPQAGQQQFPPARPPQWDQNQDYSPPWGNESGGLSAPNPMWLAQGPEVFDSSGGRSSRARIITIIVVVVVVLGLGTGGYFLFAKHSPSPGPGPQPLATTATPAPPTTTQPPRDELSIGDLPGNPEDHSTITTFDDAANANFLTPQEIKFYRTAGATKARLATSTNAEGVHSLVFTTQAASATAAATAVTGLSQQQLIYGMKAFADAPTGVQVEQVARSANIPATIRAHYVHNDTIVRIQVNGNDLTQVTAVFQQVVQSQLDILPANG